MVTCSICLENPSQLELHGHQDICHECFRELFYHRLSGKSKVQPKQCWKPDCELPIDFPHCLLQLPEVTRLELSLHFTDVLDKNANDIAAGIINPLSNCSDGNVAQWLSELRAGNKEYTFCPKCAQPILRTGGCKSITHHCSLTTTTNFCHHCLMVLDHGVVTWDSNGEVHYPNGPYRACITEMRVRQAEILQLGEILEKRTLKIFSYLYYTPLVVLSPVVATISILLTLMRFFLLNFPFFLGISLLTFFYWLTTKEIYYADLFFSVGRFQDLPFWYWVFFWSLYFVQISTLSSLPFFRIILSPVLVLEFGAYFCSNLLSTLPFFVGGPYVAMNFAQITMMAAMWRDAWAEAKSTLKTKSFELFLTSLIYLTDSLFVQQEMATDIVIKKIGILQLIYTSTIHILSAFLVLKYTWGWIIYGYLYFMLFIKMAMAV